LGASEIISIISIVLSPYLTTIAVAITGKIAYNKYKNSVDILHKVGFIGDVTEKKINPRIFRRHLKNGNKLQVQMLSGANFFTDYKQDIIDFAERGGKVEILLCNPYSDLIVDHELAQIKANKRAINNHANLKQTIIENIAAVCNLFTCSETNALLKNIEIRFCSSEYRFPIIIVEESHQKRVWFFPTLVLNTMQGVWISCLCKIPNILKGKKRLENGSFDETNGGACGENHWVSMVEEHFDKVWEWSITKQNLGVDFSRETVAERYERAGDGNIIEQQTSGYEEYRKSRREGYIEVVNYWKNKREGGN